VCNHTCTTKPCLGRNRTPLWRKEGSSLSRHSRNTSLHPNCTRKCPACVDRIPCAPVRYPTENELETFLPFLTGSAPADNESDDEPKRVPAVSPALRSTRSTREASVVSATPSMISEAVSQLSVTIPELKVIFVADPTRYSTLEDAVEWNAVYFHNKQITPEDARHLHKFFPESVFRTDDKEIYMQEFVSR
jgi:hypothetical protein